MVRQHHCLSGYESEQMPRDNEGQGSLVCCSPWGHKESDTTQRLNDKNNRHLGVERLRKIVKFANNLLKVQASVFSWKAIHSNQRQTLSGMHKMHSMQWNTIDTQVFLPKCQALYRTLQYQQGLPHSWKLLSGPSRHSNQQPLPQGGKFSYPFK